jgi:hypothetical protein
MACVARVDSDIDVSLTVLQKREFVAPSLTAVSGFRLTFVVCPLVTFHADETFGRSAGALVRAAASTSANYGAARIFTPIAWRWVEVTT